MNEKFVTKMHDEKVLSDTKTVAAFVGIWCDGHHADRDRSAVQTDGACLGIYGRKVPVLCEECESHLAYAEKRRAYCPQDPKPFCAYCETHCYKSDEREWQQQMMRYAGPRSLLKGHLAAGIKHALDGRAYHKEKQARDRAEAARAASTNQEDSR